MGESGCGKSTIAALLSGSRTGYTGELGYEIYTSPYAPTLAAGALSIAFGDFQSYWIADRTGRTVQRLNELYSTNGQVGFVATERVDGKIILPEGIQLLKMKAA